MPRFAKTDKIVWRKQKTPLFPQRGAIAQLGERIVRNDEVVGSSPTSSTMFSTTCESLELKSCPILSQKVCSKEERNNFRTAGIASNIPEIADKRVIISSTVHAELPGTLRTARFPRTVGLNSPSDNCNEGQTQDECPGCE